MREIEFRGKRVDNGEWVYGFLITASYKAWIKDVYDKYTNPRTITNKYADFRCVEIIPETVGQYTGLLDKNGKKIYEGDILQSDKGFVGKVYFEDAQWFGAKDYLGYAVEHGVEVIGNIYENSELLKEV